MAETLTLAEAFDAFWAAYPKRPWNPRARALKVFAKLVKARVDPAALIGAAGVFAADCQTRAIAPDFIPYASTWLTDRRDLDFPASTPSAPSPEGPGASEHALGWLLQAGVAAADFGAWISPLRVEDRAGVTTIIARTGVARDRVRQTWGRLIIDRLGAVDWIVERNDK